MVGCGFCRIVSGTMRPNRPSGRSPVWRRLVLVASVAVVSAWLHFLYQHLNRVRLPSPPAPGRASSAAAGNGDDAAIHVVPHVITAAPPPLVVPPSPPQHSDPWGSSGRPTHASSPESSLPASPLAPPRGGRFGGATFSTRGRSVGPGLDSGGNRPASVVAAEPRATAGPERAEKALATAHAAAAEAAFSGAKATVGAAATPSMASAQPGGGAGASAGASAGRVGADPAASVKAGPAMGPAADAADKSLAWGDFPAGPTSPLKWYGNFHRSDDQIRLNLIQGDYDLVSLHLITPVWLLSVRLRRLRL